MNTFTQRGYSSGRKVWAMALWIALWLPRSKLNQFHQASAKSVWSVGALGYASGRRVSFRFVFGLFDIASCPRCVSVACYSTLIGTEQTEDIKRKTSEKGKTQQKIVFCRAERAQKTEKRRDEMRRAETSRKNRTEQNKAEKYKQWQNGAEKSTKTKKGKEKREARRKGGTERSSNERKRAEKSSESKQCREKAEKRRDSRKNKQRSRVCRVIRHT